MKNFYCKKDGTIKQYSGSYKLINDVDYLCDVYNELNNFKHRQVGSIEMQKDAYGSRIVKIGNEFGGCFVLKEGTQKELIQYVKVMIQSKKCNMNRN